MSVLDDYAETVIAPRLSMVNGVAKVEVWGQAKYAVRVQVDPDRLRAQQIGINEVDQALQNWNVNLPTGQLFGAHQTFNIKAGGQLRNAAQFRPIIVTYRQGKPVRLEQVANVVDSIEDTMNATWFYTHEGGQRAINLALKRQPGVNTIEVTDAALRLIPALNAQLPPSIHMLVRGDRSKTIRSAFKDIQWTMVITLLLVVGVIFLFLHNGSATLIPALALPFSIFGTFAVMQVLGFSLNNLSMMALILCDRLRRGRRDRDAREHRAPHRGGRGSAHRVAERVEGNRLHDPDDDDVARGRLHPDPVHERHPGPAVPGVRGHDHGRDSRLRPRVDHADADAVQPVPAGRAHQARAGGAARSRVRRAVCRLSLVPRHRPAPSRGDAGRVRRGAGRNRPHVRRRPEGVHPRSGQRLDEHQHPGGAGDVVLSDVHGGPEGRRGGPAEPVHRQLHGPDGRRRQRVRRIPEHGAAAGEPRPARDAADVGPADFAAAAAPAPELPELQRLREPAVGPQHRRARREQLVQRDRPEPEHRRPV